MQWQAWIPSNWLTLAFNASQVRTNEHRDGSQGWQASCQGVHTRLLVQARSLKLELLLVVCILGLQFLHTRLKGLQCYCGLDLVGKGRSEGWFIRGSRAQATGHAVRACLLSPELVPPQTLTAQAVNGVLSRKIKHATLLASHRACTLEHGVLQGRWCISHRTRWHPNMGWVQSMYCMRACTHAHRSIHTAMQTASTCMS